jgi:hypothetical protein
MHLQLMLFCTKKMSSLVCANEDIFIHFFLLYRFDCVAVAVFFSFQAILFVW